MVTNRKIATIPTWRVDIGRIRLFATHLTMGAKGKETDMTDDFATYQDYLEMADDRDDRDDIPSYGESYDYCPHGVYVGDAASTGCVNGVKMVYQCRKCAVSSRTVAQSSSAPIRTMRRMCSMSCLCMVFRA